MGQDGEEAVESGDFQGVSNLCSSDSFRHIRVTEKTRNRVLNEALHFTDQETEVRKAKLTSGSANNC